ncbi:hypothetical protein [Streptomyces sp. WAC 06738]|uniref:hypothetical protein n=1 Tax=Streptomyces sp. WAC 06738 TaxID=2203210 RepID=UPI000F781F01|nr:hypothetical protein [Streptomyces sp. WAC 06738]
MVQASWLRTTWPIRPPGGPKSACDDTVLRDSAAAYRRLGRAVQPYSKGIPAATTTGTRLNGRSFTDRALAQGCEPPGADTIARDQNFPESVVTSWMNSEGQVTTDDRAWTQIFSY